MDQTILTNKNQSDKKLSTDINLKIDKELVEIVKKISQNKFPERKIESYASAVKEALFEFVKKNRKYSYKNNNTENNAIKTETEA